MSVSASNNNPETTVMNRQSYKVEKIIGVHMGEDNETFYKVQWAPTWEPLANLHACTHLIDEFWKSRNPNYLGTHAVKDELPGSKQISIITLENGIQNYEMGVDLPIPIKIAKNLSKKSSIHKHPIKHISKIVTKKDTKKSSSYKMKLRMPQVSTKEIDINSVGDCSYTKESNNLVSPSTVIPNNLLMPSELQSIAQNLASKSKSSTPNEKDLNHHLLSNQVLLPNDMHLLKGLKLMENNEATSIKKLENCFASPSSAFVAVSMSSTSSRNGSEASTMCESEGFKCCNSELHNKFIQDEENCKKVINCQESNRVSTVTEKCFYPNFSFSKQSFSEASSAHSESLSPSNNFETVFNGCPGSASSSSISFGSLPGSSLNEPVQNFLSGSHASFSEHGSILNDAKQFDSYAEHFKSPKSFKKVVKCPFCINVAYVVDDEEGLTSFNNHLTKKHASEENISGLEDYVKCPMCVKHYKSLRSCYTHLNFAHAIPAVGSSLQSSDENKCNSNEQSNKSWKVAHKETASSKELEPVLSLDPIIPISNTSRVDLITQDVLRKPSTSLGSFPPTSSLQQSVPIDRRKKPYPKKCPHCNLVVSCRKEHSEHLRIFHKKTPLISNDTIKTKKRFFCNICGLPHSSKASLKRHSRINHENSFPCSSLIEETFKCPLCPEERRTYHHLLVHLQTRHSKWSPLKTTKKPRKELKSSMTALQQRAIKTKLRCCKLCRKRFTNRFALSRHYALCHKNMSKKFENPKNSFRILSNRPKVEKVNKSDKFVCDKCPSVFTDRTSFVFHKRNHRSDYSEIGFECLICGWKTKWKTTIASHVRNNHPDDDEKSFVNLKDKECTLNLTST
ncbi:uncharacterized protein LOC101241058 isoform X2 [Hydra vulgaris]|uniref:uncharacterized protein LOC101241058 isoform X2 n=1 Tax=Hydra vulgaris TaxID=6087 RepID=UPI00064109AC|nr:uncharacterized protein LOC101241058 isoform X2 [Hydra vulgaris]